MGAVFKARYPGRCDDCREPIEVGQEVTYVDDVLVHLDCGDGAPVLGVRPNEKVCETCWLIHPEGACSA